MTEMPKETVHTTTDDSVTTVEVEIKEDEEVPKVEKETETTEQHRLKTRNRLKFPQLRKRKMSSRRQKRRRLLKSRQRNKLPVEPKGTFLVFLFSLFLVNPIVLRDIR